MKKLKYDLTNKIFGRLKALSFSDVKENNKHRLWRCLCDCGTICYVRSEDLRKGNKKSCGCTKKNRGLSVDKNIKINLGFLESLGVKKVRRGLKSENIYEYRCWFSMMSRCYNPKKSGHKYYSNIDVCSEWYSFEKFLIDMGKTSKGMTLDRIDSEKGYCKNNCRWATKAQQVQNRRKWTNKNTSLYKGVTKTKSGTFQVKCGNKHIGSYKTEIEAAKAYNKAAKAKYGEFAYQNKITDFEED